jgi:hypothetical protein
MIKMGSQRPITKCRSGGIPGNNGLRCRGCRMRSIGKVFHCSLAVDLRETVSWNVQNGAKNRTSVFGLVKHKLRIRTKDEDSDIDGT